MLWIHPLAIHFPLSLAAAAALGIWLGPGARDDRLLRLARLVAASAMSAMVFLQLMAPILAQGVLLGRRARSSRMHVGQLAENLWIFLAAGLHRKEPWNPDYTFPTLSALAGDAVWPWLIVFGVIPALAAVGALRVWRRPDPERISFFGVVAAAPLLLLNRVLADFLLIERFAIFGLVAVVPLVAIGLEGVLKALLPRRAERIGVPAGLVLGLVAFQLFVAPQTRLLIERPLFPSREVAEFLAAAGEGVPGGAIRAGAALGGNVPDVYDPWIVQVFHRDDLAELRRRSAAEGRPLYVFYGYNTANRNGPYKDLFEELDDARAFEEVAHFGAVESEYVVRVFRYTGHPPGAS